MRHERWPRAGASYRCSLALPDEAFSQNTDLLPGLDQGVDLLSDVPKKTGVNRAKKGEIAISCRDCGQTKGKIADHVTRVHLPSRWESSFLPRDRCACSRILLPAKSTNVFATAQRTVLRGMCPAKRLL